MRKILSLFIVLSFLIVGNASALTFLQNWGLDADGDGAETVNEYIDTVGLTYVDNTFTSDTEFNFEEIATFITPYHDGLGVPWDVAGEITAVFTGTGSGTLGGDLIFDSGTLDLYYDESDNYGTTADSTYGAADGDMLGSFNLMSGYAALTGDAVPNGVITITLESTELRADTWFDEDGNDLSLTDPINWVLGFATTNASLRDTENEEVPSEDQIEAFGIDGGFPLTLVTPEALFLSNNGQYRLAVVPEPSTFLLLGGGLLGLGFCARRKKK